MSLYKNIYTKEEINNYFKNVDKNSNETFMDEYYNLLISSTNDTRNHIHHILPKSIFPELKNDNRNLIGVSISNHLEIHKLIPKIFSKNKFKCKMLFAYVGMNNFNIPYICEFCKIETDILHYSQHHGEFCKHNPNRDLRKSSRFTFCEFCEEFILTSNFKMWHGEFCKHNPNRKESPYKNRKSPELIFCEHCNKYIPSNGFQFHGEFCKYNPNRTIREKRKLHYDICIYCGVKMDTANLKIHHNDNCKLNPNRSSNKINCEFCGKSFDRANYKRWHGNNCKYK
jgi:hypothetical protein